jgi:hypothetical protein
VTETPKVAYFRNTKKDTHCPHRQCILWHAHDTPGEDHGVSFPYDKMTAEDIYSVCNLSLMEVNLKIAIGHPRDLIDFAK